LDQGKDFLKKEQKKEGVDTTIISYDVNYEYLNKDKLKNGLAVQGKFSNKENNLPFKIIV
jgi:hypothetical protein